MKYEAANMASTLLHKCSWSFHETLKIFKDFDLGASGTHSQQDLDFSF